MLGSSLEPLAVVTSLLVFLATTLVVYVKISYGYWKRRGVPSLSPSFPLGNLESLFMRGIGIGSVSKKFYDEFKARGHKFGGVFLLTRPMLLVVDPELVKNVMARDFDHFVDRGMYYNERDDPLNANLFSIEGNRWRTLRMKLTPTFTSGKMKTMFHVVMDCCNNMHEKMLELVEAEEAIELKEVAARLTTDIIGSVAFGIECNSFKDPNAEFRATGKKVFDPSKLQSLYNFIAFSAPSLARRLRIGNVPKHLTDFFRKAVEDAIAYRRENGIVRKDFLQMLIDLHGAPDGEGITSDEVAAQSFVFFLAGFETTSSTMAFCIYELCKRPELQEKIRQEVNEVLARHGGEITYDSIAEMKYMKQVIDETLRKYPPLATLNRDCTKTYRIPDTDVVLEKGMGVLIPVLGLHKDPENFPDPEVFDPDRFSEENKKTRHPFSYLPFGEGPRNCIGIRFGLMQTKVGLSVLLKNYEFSINPKTIEPLRMDTLSFLTSTLDPIWLNAKRI